MFSIVLMICSAIIGLLCLTDYMATMYPNAACNLFGICFIVFLSSIVMTMIDPIKETVTPVKILQIYKTPDRMIIIHEKGEIITKDISIYTSDTNNISVVETGGKNIYGWNTMSDFKIEVK